MGCYIFCSEKFKNDCNGRHINSYISETFIVDWYDCYDHDSRIICLFLKVDTKVKIYYNLIMFKIFKLNNILIYISKKNTNTQSQKMLLASWLII